MFHVLRMYCQSTPIATALKTLKTWNKRALYASRNPLQIINNRIALLHIHHFIFHPLQRLAESEQYHLLYSSIEDIPAIADKLRYIRHMKCLGQKAMKILILNNSLLKI